jgi:hypothetical protein
MAHPEIIPLYRALRQNLIIAKQDENLNMAVLTDAAGHKVAQKLYHSYISDSDYSKLPAFVQGLDALLARFGAGQQQGSNDEEDESAEPVNNAKPNKSNKNANGNGNGGEDSRDKF